MLCISYLFGSANIKYLKYKKFKPVTKIYQRKAVDVLYENMIFYDEKGRKLFLDIREYLAKHEDKRGDLLAKMAKLMSECKAIAIECASKLAPYQSPKLESIEVNKKVTHRYVIQAPQQIHNADDWLKSVQQNSINSNKNTVKLIDHSKEEIVIHPRAVAQSAERMDS